MPFMYLVLVSTLPIEFHLYLGVDEESRCIARAFEISTSERPTFMPQDEWLRVAGQHEAIRAEIALCAKVVIHHRRDLYEPRYAFSEYEKSRRFGWVESPRTGRTVRAWADTFDILKHVRYLCLLARNQKKNHPDPVVKVQTISGECGPWSYQYSWVGPNRDLKVFPPVRMRGTFNAYVGTPVYDIRVATIDGITIEERDRCKRLMDMGSGLIYMDGKPGEP